MIYTVIVDTETLTRDEPWFETFLFTDEHEAEQFRDHLRDLYELDVNIGVSEIQIYDKAIEVFVELFGPSKE